MSVKDKTVSRSNANDCANSVWNFRANESNQVYLNCRVQPKISQKRHYGTGDEVLGQAH